MISPEDENVNLISDKAVRTALDTIKQFCLTRKLSIAAAESVSSGFLQVLLSSEEGAGMFYEGGITAYSCQQKSRHLDIPYEICDPCNGVALDISQRMALKVCELFDAKIGLSLTGYASPIPEQNLYELYAFGSIVLDGEVVFSEKIISTSQNPDEIRKDYAKILVIECAKLLNIRMK